MAGLESECPLSYWVTGSTKTRALSPKSHKIAERDRRGIQLEKVENRYSGAAMELRVNGIPPSFKI